MTMARIRVGVLGLGAMGRHHVRNVRATKGFDLVAVADPAGDRYGAATGLNVLTGVADLISAGIDAAIVAVPTAFHEEAALALADAGIHTLVEKPLSASVESGERICRAFESAGVVAAVGYVERCNPALMEMRRRIEAGQLGHVYQITTRRQSPYPARISDVGVVKDLATHDVDLVEWVAGSTYESVYAQTTSRSGRDMEDMLVASGRLASGALVNHVVNWLTPFKERTSVVTGERGSLVADTLLGDLTFYENGSMPIEWDHIANFRGVTEGTVTRYAITKREPLAVEHENFRDAILGVRSDHVSLAEGVRVLRIVEAMLESARINTAANVTGAHGSER